MLLFHSYLHLNHICSMGKDIQILLFQSEMHLHIIALLYCQHTDNPSSWYGPTHFHSPLLWNHPKRVLTYDLLGIRALPCVDFKISMRLKHQLHTPFNNPLYYSWKMWLFHAWPMAHGLHFWILLRLGLLQRLLKLLFLTLCHQFGTLP